MARNRVIPQFNMNRTPDCIRAAAENSPAFKIQFQENESLELMIMDYIGDDGWGGGVSAQEIQTILSKNRNKPIDMKINSLGGSFYDGLSMFNALLDHPEKVTATVTGIAYSAATLPLMAADHVIMPEASDFGIHRAWSFAMGNAKELLDVVDWLKSVDEHGISVYQAKSGASHEQVTAWVDGNVDGTKFTAKEAFEAGFADEVIPLKTESAAASKRTYDPANARRAMEIQHKLIKARLGT